MHDLRKLEAFVSVVTTGSLAASTVALGVPKSTLSRQIKKLEETVGEPLLLRKSRRIEPNEAGRIFYRYSYEVLQLWAQTHEALSELKEEVSGELVLHCHEALVRGWVSPLVEKLLGEHADLQVIIRTQRDVPEQLESGVGLWLGPVGATKLRQQELGCLSQGIWGSAAYFRQHGMPATPAELAGHAWVGVPAHAGPELLLYHREHGHYPVSMPACRLSVDQFSVLGDAIAAGKGLGLMPHWMAERRMRGHPGSFQRCLPGWQGACLPVSLLYPYGHLPRRIRAFIAYVRKAVPEQWCCGPGRSCAGEE
ncbi:LysR family transcriptional regulator [Granulosicoccaceae sp. 1_MG-2023]|nr:LysR family transcriptional regulator [Granulosicoccaceae sp. 1_MG-2023]